MPSVFVAIACALAAVGIGSARAADEPAADLVAGPLPTAVERSAADGQYLPLTLAPTAAPTAVAASQAGYDGARGAAVMITYADVRVWGPLAVRGAAELSDTANRLRPSIGARLQLLSQGRHGVDGAVALLYKAEGFNEPEGEIELVLSAGKRFGRTMLLANLAYGQDPEARERDGEARVAALVRLGQRAAVGVDGRLRFDLGSDAAKLMAAREPRYDLDVGPVAALPLGPVALIAHAGLSVIQRVGESTSVGAIALGGVGTSF